MTVSSATNRTTAAGNGTTTVFPYPFRVLAAADLVVTLVDASGVETLQVQGTHYTVSGVGNANGGAVTFTTAPASGVTVILRRLVAATQLVDLTNQGQFLAETHERVFDRLTMLAQQSLRQSAAQVDGAFDAGGVQISNVADPTAAQDAATRGFVEARVAAVTGSGTLPQRWAFTGNGTSASFAIAGAELANPELYVVSLSGVLQEPSVDYTIAAGTSPTITFASPPPNGVEIVVRCIGFARPVPATAAPVTVSVRDYGATGDGVTDDRAAVQAAITAVSAAPAGGVVYFPPGRYRITGVSGSDGVIAGLSVPYTTQINRERRVRLVGAGRSTVLLAATNNMKLVRWSDSHGGMQHFALDCVGGVTGATALAVIPDSVTQTTTVVNQNYNIFRDLYIVGFAEGVEMRAGPNVGGTDSGCWYNRFDDISIGYTTRGLWLRNPTMGTVGSSVNRNIFSNVRVGEFVNTGLHIEAGDTNQFYGCAFEGIEIGTSPSTTPTAIRIPQAASTGFDNNSNTFFGCKFEANTRDLDNANARTELYGCNATIPKSLFTQLPMVMLGDSPSDSPMIIPGVKFATNALSGAAGATVPVGLTWLDGTLGAGAKESRVYGSAFPYAQLGFTRETAERYGTIANGAFVDFPIVVQANNGVQSYAADLTVVARAYDVAYPDGITVRVSARVAIAVLSNNTFGQYGLSVLEQATTLGVNDYRASTKLTLSLVVSGSTLSLRVTNASGGSITSAFVASKLTAVS